MNIRSVISTALLSAACTAFACQAETFRYTEGDGTLELKFSEESGDPLITINTVNPNTYHTCEFESQGCSVSDDGFSCFTEEGLDPVNIKFIDRDTLEVTSFPSEYCGTSGNALGVYKVQK